MSRTKRAQPQGFPAVLMRGIPGSFRIFPDFLPSADRKRGQRKRATSKIVKKCQKYFRHFSTFFAQGKKRQKSSKSDQKHFRHFSRRGASFPAPLSGGSDSGKVASPSRTGGVAYFRVNPPIVQEPLDAGRPSALWSPHPLHCNWRTLPSSHSPSLPPPPPSSGVAGGLLQGRPSRAKKQPKEEVFWDGHPGGHSRGC